MKVKLYLHGHLKDKVQKDFVEVEATTLIDALRNFELKYRKVLKAPIDIGRWKIKVKGFEDKESWYVPLFMNEIHIYPEFRMGKSQSSGAWIQIGVAVALVASAVILGPASFAVMGFGGLGVISGSAATWLAFTGVAMMASGLLNLLFTQPTPDTVSTNSKYLGVAQNTTKSGTRIPFGYGLFKISGQILSYNISSSNIKVYGE